MRTYKIRTKHIKDCFAIQRLNRKEWPDWLIPWNEGNRIEYLDSIGRNNSGKYMWLVFNCKNINCHAELLINISSIMNKAPIK